MVNGEGYIGVHPELDDFVATVLPDLVSNSSDCEDYIIENCDEIIESIDTLLLIENDLINGHYNGDQHYKGCELENYKDEL